ncbi:MAG: hypothetical protein EP343_29895 [Deltaproteobacteria bacterium]|nr:MAG: hypothetical protein EP343_29895 [Deltaproteobacteria bacterium]
MQTTPETHLPMLWIDSNTGTASLVSSALHRLPVQWYFASNFKQARQILDQRPIELVVLDLALETNADQETCFQFADWLRQESTYSFVDLVLTSGYYTREHYGTITLLRYQALDFWEKPYTAEQWRCWLKAYMQGDDLPKSADLKALSEDKREQSPLEERLALEPQSPHEPSWPPLRPPNASASNHQDRSLLSYAPDTASSSVWPTPPEHSATQTHSQARMAYLEGNGAFQRRDFVQAHQCYQQASQLHALPRYQMYEAWTLYLLSPQDNQVLASVHHTLSRLAHENPALEQAHLFLGHFYIQQGQPHEAVRWYQDILAQQPHLHNVAEALHRLKCSIHATTEIPS